MALNLRRRHDRRFIIDLVAIALTLAATSALAAETTSAERQSFSTGRFVEGEITDGRKPELGAAPVTKQRSAVMQSLNTGFWVYDAQVTLYFDDDRDGFYYGLDVAFDADTDFFAADVYARLYLSYENGPWEEYFTTDYFTLFGSSADDDYVVETELFAGYPTGYYDVLIELYDDFGDLVAVYGPADSPELSVLPLEDQQRDAPVIETVTVTASRGGGGSLGWPLIVLLGLGVAARRRASGAVDRA